MAKLAIKKQNTFAGNLAAANNIAEFGSKAEGTPEYSLDPDDIQSRAEYPLGLAGSWQNNASPFLQDLNGLFFLITRQLEYLQQTGIAEWITTSTYQIGSLVNDGTGMIYKSVTDANTGNALTSAANWMPIISKTMVTVINVADDHVVNNSERYIFINVHSDLANQVASVRLPTPSALNCGREIMVKYINSSASDYWSYVYTADASTIDGAEKIYISDINAPKTFISNGTNWCVI
jgi:hypothetical protein